MSDPLRPADHETQDRAAGAEREPSEEVLVPWLLSLEPVDPPESAWSRLTERIGFSPDSPERASAHHPDSPPRRRLLERRVGMVPAAVSTALAAGLAALITHTWHPEARRSPRPQTPNASIPASNESIAQESAGESGDDLQALSAPTLEVFALQGVGEHASQHARLLWDKARNMCYLFGSTLQPAEQGETYRLWMKTDAGRSKPLVDFDLDSSGSGAFEIPSSDEPAHVRDVRVSRGAVDDPARTNEFLLVGQASERAGEQDG